jgi:hypothetical protein
LRPGDRSVCRSFVLSTAAAPNVRICP